MINPFCKHTVYRPLYILRLKCLCVFFDTQRVISIFYFHIPDNVIGPNNPFPSKILFSFIVLGESDLIYTNTLLGLERSNSYSDKTVLILGGGDGGLLHELLKLSPRFVIMVEVSYLGLVINKYVHLYNLHPQRPYFTTAKHFTILKVISLYSKSR